MIYKCNKCGDTFDLDKQDKWCAYCFHCGKGLLQLIKAEVIKPKTKNKEKKRRK